VLWTENRIIGQGLSLQIYGCFAFEEALVTEERGVSDYLGTPRFLLPFLYSFCSNLYWLCLKNNGESPKQDISQIHSDS